MQLNFENFLKKVPQKFGYINYIVLLCTTKSNKMNIIDKFIEHHEERVVEMFKKQKGITPFITFLCQTNEGKGEVMVFEIPEQLMFNEGKDFVRNVVVEKIKNKLKRDGKNLVCVNWNSEGWMYKGSKDEMKEVDGEYRKLPKTEVLLMTFDSEEGSRQITYEVKRSMFVGEEGLNEEVEVELMKLDDSVERGGRFSNLYS